VSDFGDFDDDDAFDREPPDPEQVAIKLHKLRRQHENLPTWELLSDDERQNAIAVIVLLLAWLKRQGALV